MAKPKKTLPLSERTIEAVDLAANMLSNQFMENIRTVLQEGAEPLEPDDTIESASIVPNETVKRLYQDAIDAMIWEVVVAKIQAKIDNQGDVTYMTHMVDDELGGTIVIDAPTEKVISQK